MLHCPCFLASNAVPAMLRATSSFMKALRFFPVLFLAATLLIAEEKPDAGPPSTPEQEQAVAELTKRGVLVQPLAANLNWRYVNFRGVEKPDAATLALAAKLPGI